MYFSSCTAPLAITVSGALEILYDDDDDDDELFLLSVGSSVRDDPDSRLERHL